MQTFLSQSQRITLSIAVMVLLCVPAFGQITITSDQFLQAFSQNVASITYDDSSAVGLQAFINQTGPNQTWNFQNLLFTADTVKSPQSFVMAYPGGAVLADSFPTATHVVITYSTSDTSYDFYQINQTGFYVLGSVIVSNGQVSINAKYTPPLEDLPFPLTDQASSTSISAFQSPGFSGTEEIDVLVDGSGTFVLPGNRSVQGVRFRQKVTILTPPIIIGTDTISGSDVSYTFVWFSISGYSASVDADSNQQANYAAYTVPSSENIVSNTAPGSGFSIHASSNPISTIGDISFSVPNSAPVQIMLMDPLGREGHLLLNGMAHSGVNIMSFDPSTLSNGTYFLRMESEGKAVMQKLVVAH